MHVGRYGPAAGYHEDPTRLRKLLLERRELKKLEKAKESEGLTIVPLKLFVNEKSLIKIEVGLARGKKNYDKRIAIKERDLKRRLERNT
jgi:SsrA-binding protein